MGTGAWVALHSLFTSGDCGQSLVTASPSFQLLCHRASSLCAHFPDKDNSHWPQDHPICYDLTLTFLQRPCFQVRCHLQFQVAQMGAGTLAHYAKQSHRASAQISGVIGLCSPSQLPLRSLGVRTHASPARAMSQVQPLAFLT